MVVIMMIIIIIKNNYTRATHRVHLLHDDALGGQELDHVIGHRPLQLLPRAEHHDLCPSRSARAVSISAGCTFPSPARSLAKQRRQGR
jgi:hypothetical protein